MFRGKKSFTFHQSLSSTRGENVYSITHGDSMIFLWNKLNIMITFVSHKIMMSFSKIAHLQVIRSRF